MSRTRFHYHFSLQKWNGWSMKNNRIIPVSRLFPDRITSILPIPPFGRFIVINCGSYKRANKSSAGRYNCICSYIQERSSIYQWNSPENQPIIHPSQATIPMNESRNNQSIPSQTILPQHESISVNYYNHHDHTPKLLMLPSSRLLPLPFQIQILVIPKSKSSPTSHFTSFSHGLLCPSHLQFRYSVP